MTKQIVRTDQAPAALGPYSQGVVANGLIFTAGQIPLIPGTRTIAEGGIQGQTRQVLNNLKAIVEAAGSSLDKAVKATVYLKDVQDFAAMNEVYATFFTGDNPPARSTLQAVLPHPDALVEIDLIVLA